MGQCANTISVGTLHITVKIKGEKTVASKGGKDGKDGGHMLVKEDIEKVIHAIEDSVKPVVDLTARDIEFTVPEANFSMVSSTTCGMGWKPDLPDHRDWILDVPALTKVPPTNLPKSVDLRPQESWEVYNQGHLGSCTANAIAAAFHFEQLRQGVKDPFMPSRLFIYYNERAMEDTITQDCGACLRDGIMSLNRLGVCDEKMWPYEQNKFKVRPPPECYSSALMNTCKAYARVNQDLDSLKGCLAAGFPFVFGFVVYTDFSSEQVRKAGIMKFPPTGNVRGGHAVQACGYDDDRKVFIVRNSWGPGWGDKGHFYMPYEYIVNPQLAHDFWAIKFVHSGEFPTLPPRKEAK